MPEARRKPSAAPAKQHLAEPIKERSADAVLYGATGYTGHLAAHAMERSGVAMVLAGRNRESLRKMAAEFGNEHPIAVARHDDPVALGEMASLGKVLVSTAGPFAEVGELTVAAAVASGSHYLDSTGETDFMAQTYRRHHTTAHEKGLLVMNSCAFEYVFGDCAVELALEAFPKARSLRVSYALPKDATRGTTLSALRIVFGKRARSVAPQARRIDFPAPIGQHWAVAYDGGEREYVPRRHPDVEVTTLMDMPQMVARGAGLLPLIAPVMSSGVVRAAAARAVQRMPEGPDAETRARQEWMILVEVDPDQAGRRRLVVTGSDPYGLTGEILARTAARLAAGKQKAAGVLSPAQAFDPQETLDSMADLGVAWRRL
jgi:short subunit dehydrogenase-like uncharacterized protein